MKVLALFGSFIPNLSQDWVWTPSGTGFTVCNPGGIPCLSDNGSEVAMGSTADIIFITNQSAIRDLTTGRYFQDPANAAADSHITTGTTQSAWTVSSSLH